MCPTHEMRWNQTRRQRPWADQQGDPRRWDGASLVLFLCGAYGTPDAPLSTQDFLPDPLVPPPFDATEGADEHRRLAAGLISVMTR